MTDTERRLYLEAFMCAVIGVGTIAAVTQLAPIVLVLVGQWAKGF